MQGNEQQKKAIVWNTGPALILAGPGSGKTFTTVERVRYLIEVHKVDPSSILVITFTKAAARQMRDRFFARMEGKFHPVTFGTFHAVFFQILKTSCHYRSDSILTEKEKKEYLRIVFRTMAEEFPEEEGWEDGLLSEIGYLKNAGSIPNGFQSSFLEMPLFKRVFLSFQKQLGQMGKLDLDDFAAAVKHLFLTKPQVLAAWQQRFSYILVDEFQDINATQYSVIKLLAGERKNLFVVGDDDQAIYGFRGSDPAIMRQFVRDYPEAETISLSVNYRCSAGIVETAGKLIGVNQQRFDKKITAADKAREATNKARIAAGKARPAAGKSEQAIQIPAAWQRLSKDGTVLIAGFPDWQKQAQCLAEMIQRFRKEEPEKTVAAIFRTNTDCAHLAEALETAKIPFRMKEKLKSPYAHPVCQDLLAYLEFAKVKRERGIFFKIMNRPCRYLSRQKVAAGQVSFPALIEAYRDKPYMQQIILRLQREVSWLAGMDLYAAVNFVRKGMGYDEYLQKQFRGEACEEAVRAADFFQDSVRGFASVEQLIAHISDYERVLAEAAAKEKEGEENPVWLMTMHGSKGLEFDLVFLPDCNEGIVPHKKSMKGKEVEEERRMFYVGMTRAKERLFLSWVSGTKQEPGFASRFLGECGFREAYRSP